MSTRSQIGFYDKEPTQKTLKKFEALIYRHSDGHPSAVLPEIILFLKWWGSERGISDTEYCSARLLQWLCNQYDDYSIKFLKKLNPPQHLSNDLSAGYTGTLGYGICKNFHGDIEYYYAIYPSKMQVYSVGFDKPSEGWKLLATINLMEEVNIDEAVKLCEKQEEVQNG